MSVAKSNLTENIYLGEIFQLPLNASVANTEM